MTRMMLYQLLGWSNHASSLHCLHSHKTSKGQDLSKTKRTEWNGRTYNENKSKFKKKMLANLNTKLVFVDVHTTHRCSFLFSRRCFFYFILFYLCKWMSVLYIKWVYTEFKEKENVQRPKINDRVNSCSERMRVCMCRIVNWKGKKGKEEDTL